MFPPGLLAGWILAKRTFPGKALLNTLVMWPLVLLPIVSGYLLLILLGRHGVIGGFIYRVFGIEIVFTQVAVVHRGLRYLIPTLSTGYRDGDGVCATRT